MPLSSLLAFAITLMIAAGSPGPSIAALVARVLTHGMRDVLPFLAAMWIGEALWLTCAVSGLAVLAHTFGTVFLVLRYVGVAYLLYLAWKMWRAPATVRDDALAARPAGQSGWRMFGAGLLVTLGNPKIMVFYLALVPTVVDLSHIGVAAWAELTATMLAVLIAVDFGWAAIATRARALLKNRRAVRVANRTSAVVMAGAAAAIATR
ncbi:LysE family translocator [Paraburkholderia caballeronis]|uniref:Threonine/homoserine/homoserine lactone efflux protein n=1 Tax=Paraburkholderia caballeronis TaxID=416943 RepID=A0A1H7TTJ8_9BURK|nr:LysE family translocator [Paraburkholderia caballeronis]PXW17638.1 threonine/homoserine/homoserine lactone efflux protein [Paraburkholderia caballeronis]PXW95383.1 threonine/homoserine/homoserine lactone efflux protein [Paraburkholderia caballeronis]RAJ91197.1 threonine/homoserine/homoserine lactone efflux protein [Paraburkholderia caballeronis]SEE13260.1 Threonine/homoserine/homoserine lactone efflux protein [Paraburkholderia caballeronis]SEL87804.1 Threonine/homoserine/homoserine lactone 